MATILLLDDDADFRALVEPSLRRGGHQVAAVAEPSLALDLLETGSDDLIIVGGMQPDEEGLQYLEELRRRAPDTRVVFITANWWDQEGFERLTQQLKVSRVLFKPIAPQELAAQVDMVLRQEATTVVKRRTRHRQEAVKRGRISTESLKVELDRLRRHYATILPGKLTELEEALTRIRTQQDMDHVPEAIRLSHKLHGTAGSYGYPLVSEAASKIESTLREVRERSRTLDASAWRLVDEALQQARVAAGTEGTEELDGEDASEVTGTAGVTEEATAHLLLVTDDPALREPTTILVQESFLRVLQASTTEQALELARTELLDGAILSTRMQTGPITGVELARQLRSLAGYSRLPIAFISPVQALEERIAAIHAGGSLIISSPPSAEELVAAAHHLAGLREETGSRILLLDDDEDFTRHTARLLRRHRYTVSSLNDPGHVLQVVEEFRPDLLLLDMVMPLFSGLDVCKMVRSTPRWQGLPVLLLTAQSETRLRVEAFRAGADDYLLKPVVQEELLARIRIRLDRARLYRERSTRDPLTGLLTRRAFLESMQTRLEQARRTGSPLSLCLIDLDRFKRINDEHGHMAGDQVLSTLGQLLERSFRVEDLRGRWGGEEFTLAFYGVEADAARAIAERALREFSEQEFPSVTTGITYRVGFSAGVSTFPADGSTVEELFRVADVRLYSAKYKGGGHIL